MIDHTIIDTSTPCWFFHIVSLIVHVTQVIVHSVVLTTVPLNQGSSNLACDIHFPAELSSNPDQTHLSMLISVFRIIKIITGL